MFRDILFLSSVLCCVSLLPSERQCRFPFAWFFTRFLSRGKIKLHWTSLDCGWLWIVHLNSSKHEIKLIKCSSPEPFLLHYFIAGFRIYCFPVWRLGRIARWTFHKYQSEDRNDQVSCRKKNVAQFDALRKFMKPKILFVVGSGKIPREEKINL